MYELAFEFPTARAAESFEMAVLQNFKSIRHTLVRRTGLWVTVRLAGPSQLRDLGDDIADMAEEMGGEFHLSESSLTEGFSYQVLKEGVLPFVAGAAAAGGAYAAMRRKYGPGSEWEEKEWEKIHKEGECRRRGGYWLFGRCWGGDKK